jgi:ribosome-associated protein
MFGPVSLLGGVVLPADALTWRFSRSSGPGGQSVNTADSRVELLVDLGAVLWRSPDQLDTVRERLATRLDGDHLVVAASEFRSQLRNREAALDRVVALLERALAPPPPPRRPSRPSRASRVRRADGERRRREVKSLRRRPDA